MVECLMNWKGCGRKRSWTIRGLEDPRKEWENLSHDIPADIRTKHHQNTNPERYCYTNLFTAWFTEIL
jgi:hypothetical protein